MKNFSHTWLVAITGIMLSATPNFSAQKEPPMTARATGAFEVKLTPQPPDDKSADTTIARYTLDKQFHGDLEGTGKGQMLAASTGVKGSGGYVAIELVTGTLAGRVGSFTLQHSGTMTGGAFNLEIKVVPDSGTGQLTGGHQFHDHSDCARRQALLRFHLLGSENGLNGLSTERRRPRGAKISIRTACFYSQLVTLGPPSFSFG